MGGGGGEGVEKKKRPPSLYQTQTGCLFLAFRAIILPSDR